MINIHWTFSLLSFVSNFFLFFWQSQANQTHLEDVFNEAAQAFTNHFHTEVLQILATTGNIERPWAEQWMTDAAGGIAEKHVAVAVAGLKKTLRICYANLGERCASEYLDPSLSSTVDPGQLNAVKKKLQDWLKKPSIGRI